jgi:hypothetical protein
VIVIASFTNRADGETALGVAAPLRIAGGGYKLNPVRTPEKSGMQHLRFGRMETIGGRTPVRITRAELGEMQLVHNTPFTPQPQGSVSMQNALEQAGRAILPYSPDAADVDLTRERLVP